MKSTQISVQGKVINKEMSLLMKSFGWDYRLNGHEFEQTMGDSEGQGSWACCSPWGCRESDTTERLTTTMKSLITMPGMYKHFVDIIAVTMTMIMHFCCCCLNSTETCILSYEKQITDA